MTAVTSKTTCGEALIALLEQRGVELVFGIPGVHTLEPYRGLAHSSIRHVTPRHEQGAVFAADGYARVSRKHRVCLLITGPGVRGGLRLPRRPGGGTRGNRRRRAHRARWRPTDTDRGGAVIGGLSAGGLRMRPGCTIGEVADVRAVSR
jgi:thiamine pyrophosphate-dependent enzyme